MSGAELAADLWLLLAVVGLWLPVALAGVPWPATTPALVAGGATTLALAGSVPLGVAVLLGVLAGLALGGLTALLALRTDETGLAVSGVALALGLPAVMAGVGWWGTDGTLSLGRSPAVESRWLGLHLDLTPPRCAVAAGLLCALGLLLAHRLATGPAGPDLRLQREAPQAARALGVSVARLRAATLVAGSAVIALAGAGLAVTTGVLGPGDVGPVAATRPLAACLAGAALSRRRWWGPVVGVVGLLAAERAVEGVPGLPDPAAVALAVAALLLVGLVRPERARGPRPEVLERGLRRGTADAPPPAAVPGPPSPGATLTVTGARATFGSVVALAGVDLTARPGRVHAVVGPNGSGKSTLLRLLAGSPLGTAEVSLDAEQLPPGEPARVRRGLVATLQRTSATAGAGEPPPLLRAVGARRTGERPGVVLRHLLAGRSAAPDAERRAARAEAFAGVALAEVGAVLATGPRVLLLDEPAAGQDPAVVAGVVGGLRDAGLTVVLVEHDLDLVRLLADDVTVLHQGEVLATGGVEVLADPRVRAAYSGLASPG